MPRAPPLRPSRAEFTPGPAIRDNGVMAERDRPWLIRTYSGHSSARASNELYRTNLAKGQTGLSVAFDLPTQTGYDPDDVRASGEVGKVGVPVPHLGEMRHAVRRHPARRDEHVDDDQRHRDVAARHVPRARRRAGCAVCAAFRHDAERHLEGVPLARHLHLPARRVEATDGRPHRVHRPERSRVEPDQRLPVPPAGSGRDAGAGARVRTGERDRSARRRARERPDRRNRVRRSLRPHLLLHRRERSLRRRDVQDARVHTHVGPHRQGALRRRPTTSCGASVTACR